MKIDHTFVVCAYKESDYLEECIKSILNQSVTSELILVTSTPNELIKSIVDKYNITYYVNTGDAGIAQDWNFGYSKVKTKYLTIAHQDDVYEKNYAQKLYAAMNNHKIPLIAFSDYGEIRDGFITTDIQMLKIKRIMLFPLRNKLFMKSKFIRRRILSMGCAICCPSVMYAKDNLETPVFSVGFRSNVDWQAWEHLSRLNGSFVYVNSPLMYHRIHGDSETSIIIGDDGRSKEDYNMFCKFWPKCVAKLITRVYATSQKSNTI